MKRLNLPGRLAGLRDFLADTVRGSRPRAQSGMYFPGIEAFGYGSMYGDVAGGEIAPELAMRCPPVFAAVKVLSESFGQIPLNMHAKDEQGGSLGRVLQHPLADMLADIPNPHQTWLELRYYAQRSLCLHGNSFNWVVRDHRGDVAELWALRPEQVAITFDAQMPFDPIYTVSAGNLACTLRRGDILHVFTPGALPYRGDSPILLNGGAIRLLMIQEQHIAKLFGRSARPAGVLKTQRQLGAEAVKLLRNQMDETHGGSGSGQTLVLEEGMEWQQVSMSSVDAQFQEIRKQQLYEICRVFRIPPILLQDPEKSSLNNTETLGRFFLSYTLQPLLEAWEQSLQLSLLTRGERRQYYLQHDLNEFQRAESQARWTANVAAVVNGIMTVNEVRTMEHMPPVEGGDERRVPVNTAPWQQGAVGQTAHAVNPSQTMLAPLNPGNQTHARALRPQPAQPSGLQQSRDRLERFLARSPERLRLTAPPKGVSNRPRAGAIDVNPNEDTGNA